MKPHLVHPSCNNNVVSHTKIKQNSHHPVSHLLCPPEDNVPGKSSDLLDCVSHYKLIYLLPELIHSVSEVFKPSHHQLPHINKKK